MGSVDVRFVSMTFNLPFPFSLVNGGIYHIETLYCSLWKITFYAMREHKNCVMLLHVMYPTQEFSSKAIIPALI